MLLNLCCPIPSSILSRGTNTFIEVIYEIVSSNRKVLYFVHLFKAHDQS